MEKLFIKVAVVMFLFGTMWGSKGAMLVQAAQTDAKYMQDVLVDEEHFPDKNFRKSVEDLHTLKTTRIKVKSSWVRETFNKKTWACVFAKNGMDQKKVKVSKKKITIL